MPIPEIDIHTYKQWKDEGKCITIDVREDIEFKTARIEGTTNMPLSEFEKHMDSIDPNTVIVFQCRSGKRSQTAGDKFKEKYPNANTHNLTGGILAWQEAGFKTLKAKNILPVERQMQITAGVMIITGVALAHISFEWIYLSLFVGCGLTFAGLTGWCGMVKLLAKMPWNK